MLEDRMTQVEELFITNTGSHLWKMNTPESDIDLWVCYIAPSSDFLIGKQHTSSHHSGSSQPGEVDRVSHELGTVVHQLMLNNFNYLAGVLSPLVIKDWDELPTLRKLVLKNISKLCYNSIHGLAVQNYKKYILNKKDNTIKRRQTIMRTVLFGVRILEGRTPEFLPVIEGKDYESTDIPYYINTLEEAYENSNLPDKPKYEKEMYDWLLKIRMTKLAEEALIK